MVTAFNIVYNTVINFIVELKLLPPYCAVGSSEAAGVYRRNREDDGRKTSQTRDRPNAEIPPDTGIATA